MKTVICDANIWYNLANEKINPDKFKDDKLIGTSVNIIEISSSPNLISDLDLVIRTIKAFHRFNEFLIPHNPLEHLISLFYLDFIPEFKVESHLLDHFGTLMNINTNEIPAENIEKGLKQIEKLEEENQKSIDSINERIALLRKNLKADKGLADFKKTSYINSWKLLFSDLVTEYSLKYFDKEIKLDPNSDSWNNLEFFLHTWEAYFKKNLPIGNWKFDKNDWEDLLNLVYVQPGIKYWTKEKKWNKLFIENERLQKYLYL